MKLSTEEDLRNKLRSLLKTKKNGELAAEIGISPSLLSMLVNGYPLSGKAVAFLGYRKVRTKFFERLK
jgi:hypothetical protein